MQVLEPPTAANVASPARTTQASVAALLSRHLAAIGPRSCGFGLEPGQPKPHHDAMAWSLYGRGFLRLHQATRERRFLEAATICYERLLRIRSQVPRGQSAWGLPYPWKAQPEHHPYGITTAMCGDFLLDAAMHRIEGAETHVVETVAWLMDGIQWWDDGRAACPSFAPGFEYLATNVAARTAAFLLRAHRGEIASPRARDKGLAALRYVLRAEIPPGVWTYGRALDEEKPVRKVDNLHTGYVLEGLATVCHALGGVRNVILRRKTSQALERGTQSWFGIHYAVDPPVERVHLVHPVEVPRWKRRPDATILPLSDDFVAVRLAAESRAWAIGSALTVLAERDVVPGTWLDNALAATQALARADGGFNYKRAEPSRYVRHDAHIFFGLASLRARYAATS